MHQQTLSIKQSALSLGFFACGVARVGELSEDRMHYEDYLERGDFGEMVYLTRYLDKRFNPARVLEHAKSVVVVLWDYSGYDDVEMDEEKVTAGADLQSVPTTGKIAKYAQGEDYHVVIKTKLLQLEDDIRKLFPQANMRSFVDASPVLEKAWAIKAGLGFRGKNTLLINPTIGSYCNIGVILLDQALTCDTPLETTCGACSECLQHCPTGALERPYQLNARKCISYYNTEKKRHTTIDLHGWARGCDECQRCCPWNTKHK